MSSTRSRSKQSNRNEFTRFLALESINKSRIINLQLYLGSRLYVGVIPLSCLMAKLGNGKGKCKQNVQSLPSHHAPNPMGRSKGTMRKTSQQLSTPTRLATQQTPETPSREHSTPTHPATEQKPEIPTDEDVAMHDPGNTSIVRCANALIRRANANANALNIAPTPSISQCANALHGAQTPSQTYTHTERKRPQRRDKDDSENSELNGFLRYVVRENYPWLPGLKYEDIEDIVFEKIIDWLHNPKDNASYSHEDLQLHKKLWAIMNTDKDSCPKDHEFCFWCRRIALHRTKSIAANNAATEHADITANNAATRHANAFRMVVKDIYANVLTPSQRRESKYRLDKDSSISTQLRSLVNVILRKNLGDARVATYILEHGVPTLLDPPWCRSDDSQQQIDSMLEEFLQWHTSLLRWLSNVQKDPSTILAQKLSALNEKEWQAERRRKKSDIEQKLRQGALLVNLRDTHGKRFHDMSATEQRVLEDYETGKLRKLHNEIRIRKPNQQAPPDHAA